MKSVIEKCQQKRVGRQLSSAVCNCCREGKCWFLQLLKKCCSQQNQYSLQSVGWAAVGLLQSFTEIVITVSRTRVTVASAQHRDENCQPESRRPSTTGTWSAPTLDNAMCCSAGGSSHPSDWSGATGAVCRCCWSPRCLPRLPGVELSGVSVTRSLAPAVVVLAGASVVLSPRTTDTEWLLLAAAGQSPPRHQPDPLPRPGPARPASRPACRGSFYSSAPELCWALHAEQGGTGGSQGTSQGARGAGGTSLGWCHVLVRPHQARISSRPPLVESVARLAGGCGPGLAGAGAGC